MQKFLLKESGNRGDSPLSDKALVALFFVCGALLIALRYDRFMEVVAGIRQLPNRWSIAGLSDKDL